MLVCTSCGHENSASAKFCEECGFSFAAAPVRAEEQRRTVTVLFCDLAGSTALGEALDPERLRGVLARYFDGMRAIVERHGGSVEKFIGDAVVAVFGVPLVHEDDALRAVRAAAEMRDALPGLGLEGRIGVMTGEVVTGTAERLATGDAVNVAARLEQAAQPGEVLLGQPTLALVREAAEVEPLEPLALKGKAEPVRAYRLVSVRDAVERGHQAPFVGRERELARLREVFERVQAEQRCELVTVIGEAGVGKSRLALELLSSIEATVVRGRCLPYGEGITYWPVVEVLKQLGARSPDPAAAAAIRSLLGESVAATSAEEIAWAFRKTLEHAAAEGPLVVVFDDIQWGEETFRDLIEHVALLSTGAAILLLCIARPELSERHPAWPVTLRLERLDDAVVEELLPQRIGGDLRERIARAAGGNPLFIEEMLAMAGEARGDSDVVVPPTLSALLAARLDQLEAPERCVLERGAIEGEIFHRGAVQALAPAEAQVTPRLAALVRKQLIRPDLPQLPGEDGFRFRHLLLRDAAYDALSKATRADLHERLASWLHHHGTALVELDELLGYHLEQACGYRAELGLSEDRQLTARARRHLSAAGRRAIMRQDYRAAVSLLERAAALGVPAEIDLPLEVAVTDSLYEAGRGGNALHRAESLTERAALVGDRVAELCGRIYSASIRESLDPGGVTEKLDALVEQALPELQTAGDDLALYVAYRALGQVAFTHAQYEATLAAIDHAADHAGKAGQPDNVFGWRAVCHFYGPTSTTRLLTWLDENEPREPPDHAAQPLRAATLAMLGHFDEARGMLAEARAELTERGWRSLAAAITGTVAVDVELLAGDPAAAAELGAEGCRLLEELRDQSVLSTAVGILAKAHYALDRLEEAEAFAGRARALGAADDVATQLLWRQVSAKVLARRGEHPEAERLAREAVAIAQPTDYIDGQGDTYAALAEVLQLAGKTHEAAAALQQAIERYKRKGNHVSAQQSEARLQKLSSDAGTPAETADGLDST